MPLQLTRTVLMELSRTANQRMWVDTFTVLSRIPARVGYKGSVRSAIGVRWMTGQPLGAIPSFAAFALTHHAIVRGLWDGPPAEAPYVILGDDLVIADKDLADRYKSVVSRLGVSISEPKSLQGCLGEFAGRIISAEGWEFKLKYFHLSYRTLLSMISLIGPRAVRGMPNTRLRNIIALLPTPRTPEGINPGGFPKEKRDKFLAAYYSLERDFDPPQDPWTDSERTVLIRDRVLRGILCPDPSEGGTTDAWNPTGSARVGLNGAPEGGPTKSRTTWKWTPFLSRSWLRRVKQAARLASLL